MSAEELELYKLYRQERVTPTKRSVDLLKTPSLNKVCSFLSFSINIFFFWFSSNNCF